MKPFSAQSRTSTLEQCQKETLDVIVVGGGITGAGIFLKASQAGLKTALFEQNDFASGTSSASSKLIHGGLRYLELLDFDLVSESAHERKKLLNISPDLVQPLEFLFPVYQHQRRKLLTIYLGTWIYYFLSIFRNIGRPKKCSKTQTLQLAPKLRREKLSGAVRYFDASTIDSRLTLSAIKTGWHFGGLACNHARIVDYIKDHDRIAGVVVEDQMTAQRYEVRAKWVVNAAGPWTDMIRGNLLQKPKKTLRMTKGVHIIVQGNPFDIQMAIVMLSPVDGRVVFIIPWCGQTLIGTTEDDYDGAPEDLRMTAKDLEYLRQTCGFYFPDVKISNESILSSFAGLRCLQDQSDDNPSDVTREHVMFSEQPGLLHIAGGKLTAFLSMGEEIVNWLLKQTPEWSRHQHLPSSVLLPLIPFSRLQNPTEKLFQELIEHEMAASIQDLLQNRTLSYYLAKDHGTSLIEMAARAIKTRLGFSDQQIERQIQEYKKEIEKQNV